MTAFGDPRALIVALASALCVSGGAVEPGGGGPAYGQDLANPRGLPRNVVAIAGVPSMTPRAVLVDAQDRTWVAHDDGMAIYEGDIWRDVSSGLAPPVLELHETPLGEIFATGLGAGWRWEDDRWVLRLDASGCISPLHLTSRNGFLFGVCSYYPYYVAWRSRDLAEIEIDAFLPVIPNRAAFVGDSEIYVIAGADRSGLLRLGVDDDFDSGQAGVMVTLPQQVSGHRLFDLWSPAPGRLVVVGSEGLVISLNGGSWAVEETGVSEDLVAVWGNDVDGLYAVGSSGRILFHDATGWRALPSGSEQNLISVHGRRGGRVVVAGAEGALYEILRGDERPR